MRFCLFFYKITSACNFYRVRMRCTLHADGVKVASEYHKLPLLCASEIALRGGKVKQSHCLSLQANRVFCSKNLVMTFYPAVFQVIIIGVFYCPFFKEISYLRVCVMICYGKVREQFSAVELR